MPADKFRVGYFPASTTLQAPSDRRRFVYYARRRGIEFELADPARTYDLVVLNQRADLSVWSRYRPGESRIVYEANDSYISVPATEPKQALRGLFKFVSGQSRRLQLNYRRAVEDMCRRADAVVCSTEEQRSQIVPLCPNTHIILDFQEDDVLARKTSYAGREAFHVVWEGLASSGIPLRRLRKILEPLAGNRPVTVHLVTDPVYYRYSNIFWQMQVADRVKHELGPLAASTEIHPWSAASLSQVASAADLALIPLDAADRFQMGKPENKLLLFWRMGVPALTTDTAAYVRAMDRAGLDMCCETLDEWHRKLAFYAGDEDARAHAGMAGLRIAESFYSTEETLRRWDAVMESLFGHSRVGAGP